MKKNKQLRRFNYYKNQDNSSPKKYTKKWQWKLRREDVIEIQGAKGHTTTAIIEAHEYKKDYKYYITHGYISCTYINSNVKFWMKRKHVICKISNNGTGRDNRHMENTLG